MSNFDGIPDLDQQSLPFSDIFQWFMSEKAASVSPTALRLFQTLLRLYGEKKSDSLRLSLRNISELSGLSPNTVKKARDEISSIIRVVPGTNRKNVDTYELILTEKTAQQKEKIALDPSGILSNKEIIRALLLLSDKPISFEEMLQLKIDAAEIHEIIAGLQDEYKDTACTVIETGLGFQIGIRSPFTKFLAQFGFNYNREEPPVTKAEGLVLLMVMYKGPVSRYELGQIRQHDPIFLLKSLVDKGFAVIVPSENDQVLYEATAAAYHLFQLKNKTELPPLKKIEDWNFTPEEIDALKAKKMRALDPRTIKFLNQKSPASDYKIAS